MTASKSLFEAEDAIMKGEFERAKSCIQHAIPFIPPNSHPLRRRRVLLEAKANRGVQESALVDRLGEGDSEGGSIGEDSQTNTQEL